MVRKVNYNNPIMQEYIKKGQYVKTSSTHTTTMQGFGNLAGSHRTTIIYTQAANSSSSSSSSSSMSTAEKIAAGIQIGSAGIKAATQIIEAIGDVKAKNIASGKSSTKEDKPVYKSSTSGSEAKKSVTSAKDSSAKVTSAAKEYKKTGDKSSLEMAVQAAESDFASNKAEIVRLNNEKGTYLTTWQDDVKAYNDFHKGDYKNAVDNKDATQKTFEDTKKKNDTEISSLRKKVTGYQSEISILSGEIQGLRDKLASDIKALDKDADDFESEKAALEREAERQIAEKQKDIDAKTREIEEIQGKDGNGGKIKKLNNDTIEKQGLRDQAIKDYNAADAKDKANKATMESSKADYERVCSQNDKEIKKYEAANKTLDSAIKNGMKALES